VSRRRASPSWRNRSVTLWLARMWCGWRDRQGLVRLLVWLASLEGLVACASPRDAVKTISCKQGSITPLQEISPESWPSAISDGIAAMMATWSAPLSVMLKCPDRDDIPLRVDIVPPAVTALSVYAAPPAGGGPVYYCPNAGGGSGHISIEGLTVDSLSTPVQNVPLEVDIKLTGMTSVVDAAARMPLSGTWHELVINVGIDAQRNGYGSLYFNRQIVSAGMGQRETMLCRMVDVVGPRDASPF